MNLTKLLKFDRSHSQARGEQGFTLIELLIVIVILGILATVVVFAVGGIRDSATDSACPADNRTLQTAVEAYFTTYGSGPIPAANASADGREQTLVDAGFLRDVSELWAVDAAGDVIVTAGSFCA